MGGHVLGNITSHAHWQPEPPGRGTSNILQTCIITLGLCVYSSVHQNIPAQDTTWWRLLLHKAQWVLAATLAPELVVFVAYMQRKDAEAVREEFRPLSEPDSERKDSWYSRYLDDSGGERKATTIFRTLVRCIIVVPFLWIKHLSVSVPRPGFMRKKEDFSMARAFFICMGGVAFEVSEEPCEMGAFPSKRMVLNPQLVSWIAQRCGKRRKRILSEISDGSVEDKSKATSLVKTLACVQGLWFCLQFITRLAQGLPVSLLELNTFVHTVCAILIYILWWEKPLDVSEPICPFDEDEGIRNMLHLIMSQSEAALVLWAEERLLPTEDPMPAAALSEAKSRAYFLRAPVGVGMYLPLFSIIRLITFEVIQDHSRHILLQIGKRKVSKFANPLSNSYERSHMAVALLISSAFYGGLHLIVIGTELQSRTETLLWTIACIAIIAFAPAVLLWWKFGHWSKETLQEWMTWLNVYSILFVVAFSMILFYVLCRVYIIVEVFLLLPRSDPAVYQLPNWSLYFPHIA